MPPYLLSEASARDVRLRALRASRFARPAREIQLATDGQTAVNALFSWPECQRCADESRLKWIPATGAPPPLISKSSVGPKYSPDRETYYQLTRQYKPWVNLRFHQEQHKKGNHGYKRKLADAAKLTPRGLIHIVTRERLRNKLSLMLLVWDGAWD
jgi:hypothetical protein